MFRAPAASADGRYEAYAVSKPDGAAAVVVGAGDGSSSHEFPVFGPSLAFSFAPSWRTAAPPTSAGPRATARRRIPLGPLRVVDASTGEARDLPAKDVVAFFWSPDGSRIAALGLTTPSNPNAAARPAPGTASRGWRPSSATAPMAAPVSRSTPPASTWP